MRFKALKSILMAAAAGVLLGLGTSVMAADPAPYSWTTVPFGAGGFVDGFVYHPKKAGLLYARTDIGGMYRYDYAKKSWVPLLDHFSHDESELMGVISVAVDPNDPNRLYAACGEYLGQWGRAGAILRSDDQGATWQKTELTIKLGGNSDGRGTGERLQVDPNDGQVLYLGSSQDGLWKSTDGGKSWGKTASPGTALSLVLIDPAGTNGQPSQTLYVGSADGKGGLFVSHDGGNSFAAVPGAPAQTPQHAVLDSDGTLYVAFAAGDGKNVVNPNGATAGGLWKLDKTGAWSNISPAHPEAGVAFGYSGVSLDPAHPGTIVTSTLDRWATGDDIYRSTDGGAHWTALGRTAHHLAAYPWLLNYAGGQDRMGHWLSSVEINPFNPDEMIYGTGYGLWMSENLTAAGPATPVIFDFNVSNFEEAAPTSMTSPTGGAILMATFGDVAGGAWDDLSKTPDAGVFTPATETNYSVDYAGLNPNFVARTTDKSSTNGFYSEDGGASWTAFGSTPYQRQDAQGNWHNAGVVAVSGKGTSMVWVPEKQPAFYSTDKGKTWKPSAGWPAGRDMPLIPISDKAVDGVYYVFDRYSSGILISVDGGASFKPVVTGIPKIEGWQHVQLAVVPGRLRDLWLAAPYGLLHSPDAGKAMSGVNGVDEAWQVGFGKAAPGKDYPAVYLWGKVHGKEGLYRSGDAGDTWIRINDDQHQFGWINAISGDPLDYGTVYIAPSGRGILSGKPQ